MSERSSCACPSHPDFVLIGREAHENDEPVPGARLGAFGGNAWAQPAEYPNKPIRLVVGFAPGGAADIVARVMSDEFGKALGQPVVVENKPGAGSSIAAEQVAKSRPDGYTLLIASPSSISVNPALNPNLSYKPATSSPSPR